MRNGVEGKVVGEDADAYSAHLGVQSLPPSVRGPSRQHANALDFQY